MICVIRAILALAMVATAAACTSEPTSRPILVDPSPVLEMPATAISTAAPRPEPTVMTPTAQPPTPEERRLEIEAFTKPLWFGWYAAVAAGDVDALGKSVARNRIHADGVAAIDAGGLEFIRTPQMDDYRFTVLDVLRDDPDCIVIALREDPAAFLATGVEAERIGVFWMHDRRWYLATSWTIDAPEFAWGDDCSLMVRDYT